MNNQRLYLLLNRLLANYFVIYVKLKRYKWFTKGVHVFQLRELWDRLNVDFSNDIERIAQHILLLEGKPFATMSKFLQQATIEEATADDEAVEMIEQLRHDMTTILAFIKEEIIECAHKNKSDITIELMTKLKRVLLQHTHDLQLLTK